MTRVLRLTLLAPDIFEAILDGKQKPEVTLARVLEPFPLEWVAQPEHFDQIGSTDPLLRTLSRLCVGEQKAISATHRRCEKAHSALPTSFDSRNCAQNIVLASHGNHV